MRLKPEEIKKLSTHCGNQVLGDPKNEFKVPRTQIFEAIDSVIRQHFEEERKIEQDAEKLYLEKQADFEGLQKGKALSMIRSQIAKERDFYMSGGNEGRMSADKISHLGHLVADKLYDDDLMDFPDEDDGPKFFKAVLKKYFDRENQIDDVVRKKLASLSNPPLEHSREWEIMYKKYSEEEMRKIGHE